MSEGLKGSEMLRLALWFGLFTSLAEVSVSFLFGWLGWMYWRAFWLLAPEVAPLVPILYVPLFCFLGLILLMAGRITPWLGRLQVAVFVFAFILARYLLVFSRNISVFRESILATPGLFLAGATFAIAFACSHFIDRHRSSVRQFSRASLKWVGLATMVLSFGAPGWLMLREGVLTSRLPLPSEGSPNVLVIIVDSLRADHLSTYGYPRNTSPNFDQLGQQGTLFEMAIASSSWTLPTHASIVTGLYPREHGAETRALDKRHATVAEVFQSMGYRTGAFSANPFFFCRQMGFGRGFLRFSDISNSPLEWLGRTVIGSKLLGLVKLIGIELPPARRDPMDVNRSLLHWLDVRPGKPFFAVLNYFDVHQPYFPPNPYRQMFSKSTLSDEVKQDWLKHLLPIRTPSGVRTWVDAYDGAIRFVDDQIAALLTELRKRGFGTNTLLVITADHGESFGEHGLTGHNNALYLDTIHVPLIFFWPGNVPQSVRVRQPVSLTSLPATLLDLARKRSFPSFMAPSLKPLLESDDVPSWPNPRSELAQLPYSFSIPGDPSLYGSMTSIVGKQWHYIMHQYAGEELYDWINDPKETHDLSQTPEAQKVLASFRKQM